MKQSDLERPSEFIKRKSKELPDGRLTGEDIMHYIHIEFGVHYHLNHVYNILKQLGFSCITNRLMHPKQSQENQEAF
ncbi:winged helix-turn-helix domain-containing protein [Pseudoalteromonas sp. S2755]|uniref:helix-turn-helix domain-containing protein n=1 Tax=Pseudoalteromonas sp. S2755 TaxID=2066523 RepID=UPI00110BA704|nr:winged helix-turn-helix domain-containing protein [Pseudoalteromonas sp. S2755]TMN42757.1 hypothetical protein CWC03_06100 [Pseudoalteromonas sp. S2755]